MTGFSRVFRHEPTLAFTFMTKVHDKAICGQQVKHNAQGVA